MSENQDTDITSLFKKIRDELFTLRIENIIEYLHYKESVYVPESIKTEHEEAFFHLPYVEVNTSDKIQIFHEFYTTDVWGSLGPMKIGNEKYNYSLHEISSRIKEPPAEYIFKKLSEKYANIESDIPVALESFKKSEKLSDDHPEKQVLINLLNKYRRVFI